MFEFICGVAFGLGVASLIVAAIGWQKIPKRPVHLNEAEDNWSVFDKATHRPEYDWGHLAWGLFLCIGALVAVAS